MTDQNGDENKGDSPDEFGISRFDLEGDIKKTLSWQRMSSSLNLSNFSKCQSMINFHGGFKLSGIQTQSLFSSTPIISPQYYTKEAQKKANSIPSQLYENRKFSTIFTSTSTEFYELNTINPQTLNTIISKCKLIDCRSAEEFNEGNIKSSVNVTSPSELVDLLFGNKSVFIECLEKCAILVFYCRNSKEISPFLMRFIRAIDRLIHHDKYPKLGFPNMYLLNGGIEAYIQAFKVCD